MDRVIPVRLTAPEIAIYMELFQQLVLQDWSLTKICKTKVENDRLARFNTIAGSSSSPEEALIHTASDFVPPSLGDSEDASQACEQIIRLRDKQKVQVVKEIKRLLMQAEWLHKHLPTQYDAVKQTPAVKASRSKPNAFEGFVKQVMNANGPWDTAVAKLLEEYIDHPDEPWNEAHGDLFYEDKKKDNESEEDSDEDDSEPGEDDEDNKEDQSPGEDESADEEEGGNAADKEAEEKPKRKPFPKSYGQTRRELRITSGSLRKYAGELESLTRGHSFFQRILTCQKWMALADPDPGTHSCPELDCGDCCAKAVSESTYILTTCGHILCQTCLMNENRDGKCSVEGCKALSDNDAALKVADLAEQESDDALIDGFSSKMSKLVQLLKGEIGGPSRIDVTHQVLLFVQFGAMKERVVQALKEHEISFSTIDNGRKLKKGKLQNPLQSFLNYDPDNESGSQVLILELDNENAAGL